MAAKGSVSRFSAGREKIITGIVSPLGFYALALLIVEGFILGAGSFFNLPMETRILLVWVAIGLFCCVFFVVTALVIFRPRDLVFTEKSHLDWEGIAVFGSKSQPLDMAVLDSTVMIEAPKAVKEIPPQDESK